MSYQKSQLARSYYRIRRTFVFEHIDFVNHFNGQQAVGNMEQFIANWLSVIYRLPPLPPTSQKVGWGRLLEALAHLGCSLVAFCDIWDALGSPGQPKQAIWDSCAGGSTDFKARGRWGGARGLTSCGSLWRAVAPCGTLWQISDTPLRWYKVGCILQPAA